MLLVHIQFSLPSQLHDGHKNGAKKWIHVLSKFTIFIPDRSICQMLVNFSGVEFLRTVSTFYWKELRNCCLVFTSSRKPKIRHFHIVVVQQMQRNVQKSAMARAKLLFSFINLLLLHRGHRLFGGVLPYDPVQRHIPISLSHFHDWTDYNEDSIELLEWGRTFSDFLG